MKIDINLRKKGVGAILALIGSALCLVDTVIFAVYMATYEQYSDTGVLACLILGCLCLGAYALIDHIATEFGGLLGVIFSSIAFGQMISNGLNVIEDLYGNLNMYGSLNGDFNYYGSEGSPITFLVLVIFGLVAAILAIISCFKGKETELQ